MPGFLMVFCTCDSEELALRIAHAVVERHLAACVNLLPPVQSIYRWEGVVERATEFMLVIKTTEDRFEALRDMILALQTYENPEIVAVPITAGADKYLAWVRECV